MTEALTEITEGDMRKSIMMLQTASKFCDGNLTREQVYSISGRISDDVLEHIFNVISDGTSTQDDAQALAEEIILDGFDVQQLMVQLSDHILANDRVKDI